MFLAPGSNEKIKLYLLTDVIRVLMESARFSGYEHQDRINDSKERKDWFDSERASLAGKRDEAGRPLPGSRSANGGDRQGHYAGNEVWPDATGKG